MTRKHSKYCDGIICNGKVSCPTTGKTECGKELNFKLYIDGHREVVDIWCFGCNTQHGIKEQTPAQVQKYIEQQQKRDKQVKANKVIPKQRTLAEILPNLKD